MTDLTLRILREIQADIRTLREENARISQELANKASRTETLAMFVQIVDRFAKFEAHVESRFDAIEAKLAAPD
jgi:hypothetical protein